MINLADTLPNIELSPNTWVNLYAVTGEPVGTRLEIFNVGAADVRINAGPDEPTNDDGFVILKPRDLTYDTGPNISGLWAYVPNDGGLINVRELPLGVEVVVQPSNRVYIENGSDWPVIADPDTVYFVVGKVDMTGVTVQVPAGGMSVKGDNIELSRLESSDDNYTMFVSSPSGSSLRR